MTSAACPADGTAFVEDAPASEVGAADTGSALAFFDRGGPAPSPPAPAPAVNLERGPSIGASTAKIGSALFTPSSLPPVASGAAAAAPLVGDPAAAAADETLAQPVAAGLAAAPDPDEAEDEDDPANDPMVRAEAEQLIGNVLGDRYRVDEMIGVGGMGIVYRATHVAIGKPMAIKVLRQQRARQESVAARFAQEAQLASRIKHPNVVDIVDYGVTPFGAPYYAMEFLDGKSLAWEVDNRGRMAPDRAFDIAIQIAAGLGEAHKQGVVHRDLKPDNVYLCRASDEGRDLVKLLDFGIARLAGRKTRFTAAGAVVGTPEYMSPEQAQGKEVDPRADLYSLGVILFEMMTGDVPFRAETLVGTLTKQVFEAPPPLRQAEPALPQLPNLERLMARLLAKNKDERPATAAEVIQALKASREGDLTANGAVEKPQQRATVGLGSWGVGDQSPAKAVGAVEPGRGPMLSPPQNQGWAGGEALPRRRPSVIVRDGTPSEFVPASSPHKTATGGRGVVPIVLLGAGAAVFAALLTVGLVRYADRQSSSAEPSVSEEQTVPAAVADPAPTPPAPEPVPTTEPAPSVPADPPVLDPEPPGESQTGGVKAKKSKTKKSVAQASKSHADDTPPVQRPNTGKKPENSTKPQDPPPPPSVSLGDLKDPFAEK